MRRRQGGPTASRVRGGDGEKVENGATPRRAAEASVGRLASSSRPHGALDAPKSAMSSDALLFKK